MNFDRASLLCTRMCPTRLIWQVRLAAAFEAWISLAGATRFAVQVSGAPCKEILSRALVRVSSCLRQGCVLDSSDCVFFQLVSAISGRATVRGKRVGLTQRQYPQLQRRISDQGSVKKKLPSALGEEGSAEHVKSELEESKAIRRIWLSADQSRCE